MEPAIRADGLRKGYGDVQALDGLSFEVERGAFFGLLGPNGAGKTTFINILVGLVRKDGGTAEVFGFDVESEYRQARDRIGLAPQEFNVDRFFPIHEVLEHKAGYHGVPPETAARRAEEALKTVGIWDKRETRFDWLSGGMKRRFLLARALATDPELLILDEPTAGVDVQLRRDLWRVIERLNAEGTTVLLTTHYIEEAERLCDRVAIVDSGRIVEVSTPESSGRAAPTRCIYARGSPGEPSRRSTSTGSSGRDSTARRSSSPRRAAVRSPPICSGPWSTRATRCSISTSDGPPSRRSSST